LEDGREGIEGEGVGLGEEIPAVPAGETPQVDAAAAEPRRAEDEEPAERAPEIARHDLPDHPQRARAEDAAGPGEQCHVDHVVPAEPRQVGVGADMDEVSDDVRCVRQEGELKRGEGE